VEQYPGGHSEANLKSKEENMKKLIIAAAALLLSLSGAACAQTTTVVVPGQVRTYVLEQKNPSAMFLRAIWQ
jgi:uncharacterized lipoprotein YajG